MLDARNLARLLGGEASGSNCVSAPGPGHSPKDRSLSVRLDPSAPDGFLIYSHAGDPWKVCRDHVRRRLGLPDWQPGDEQRRTIPSSKIEQWDLAAVTQEANEGPRHWSEDDLIRIARARAIWHEGRDPRGTLAETYLRRHRKLDLPDDLAGNVLRFHPACPWRDENIGKTVYIPALIAPFRNIDDDTITGIQRVRLNADGSKYDRMMLGIVKRAAIKLDPLGEHIHIGEGLETSMAGRQLGIAPAWAVGSTGGISFFPLIDGVKCVTIFAEAGEASANAIRLCGKRWRKAGRRVRAARPQNGATDMNDILLRSAAQ
jgi:hypothetical protein